MPPEAFTVNVPSSKPLQVILPAKEVLMINSSGWLRFNEAPWTVQLLLSFTFTEYAPAVRLSNKPVEFTNAEETCYCRGAIPPVASTWIKAVFSPKQVKTGS